MGAEIFPRSAMNPRRLTALDFETTGSVPGFRNEPWQIGLCSLDLPDNPAALPPPGDIDGSWLHVAPNRPFNRHAPGRHAQLRDVLADSPLLPDLWPALAPRLSLPLVAHNAATERSVLADTFPLHPFGPWIDTLALSRLAWPGLPSYALEDLVPHLGLLDELSALCPHWAPHDARYDAVAAALLLRHLLAQPGWNGLSPEDLSRVSGVPQHAPPR